ncbi:MAG: serine/threonine-protein kinase [Thermoplasmatota archaeon]
MDFARTWKGPLDAEAARAALFEILDGLAALHAAGLVHRDLKPPNVLVDSEGHVKIADLGIARASMGLDATVTRALPEGTPAYMAPEQVLGLPVDARADIYAAGLLLHESLTGRSFVRDAAARGRLVQEVVISDLIPLPVATAPAWANAFLRGACAKDPADRFPGAESARDALAEMAASTRAAVNASARDASRDAPHDASSAP